MTLTDDMKRWLTELPRHRLDHDEPLTIDFLLARRVVTVPQLLAILNTAEDSPWKGKLGGTPC